MLSFFGTKLESFQAFDNEGGRHVATLISTPPLTITQIKNQTTDGYWAYQVAIGQKSVKSLTKPLKQHLKKAKVSFNPQFIREIKLQKEPTLKVGDQIKITDIFKLHDKLKVTGTTKGRGFAGVMKRWGFAGGPRTHGQSDRKRAPGSIGMRTDPGRVWKGKKMAGHFGASTKTILGLQVIAIDDQHHTLTLAGTVPGHRNALVKLIKTGSVKRPINLFVKKSPEKKLAPKKIPAKPQS